MSCFKNFGRIVALLLLLGAGSTVHAAKTLMWLVDWFQMGNMDTVTKYDSVVIPHYNGTAKTGYYYGTRDQRLVRTGAYAAPIPVNTAYDSDTLPDSLKLPNLLDRSWWALSDFSLSNYEASRIRIYMYYKGQMHRPMFNRPDPFIQLEQYPNAGGSAAGQTDQLEGKFVQGCIDSTFGDSIWFWTGATSAAQIQSNASATSIKCLDHNPFFEKIGTVHVFNPWPGKTVYAQLGNRWYPLYQEAGRPGWMSTTLWADPRAPQEFKIRLANGDPTTSGTVQYWDAGGLGATANGTFLDYSVTPGKGKSVWIMPPLGTAGTVSDVTAPPVAMTLYIKRPSWSASAVRVVMKGLESRFIASATEYCDWFQIKFYKGAVPTSIALTNPVGDTTYGSKGKIRSPASYSVFTDWIDLGTAGGIFSMNTDGNTPVIASGTPSTGGKCDTKILAFSAYDYAWEMPATHFYEPFSEKGPDNNCPGSGNTATKGLVTGTLDPVTGMPVMNDQHKAACGIDTKVATNSPGLWFDTLWRSSTGTISNKAIAGGTKLNHFHCVPLSLKLDAAGQYYTYANSAFWPLDTVNIPSPYGKPTNGGMEDRKFAMHARAAFEYVPGLKFDFTGDDDVWIYIDRKLALDIGGQHGPISGTINLDNLGLVEGKSYQFDMFYTERMGLGSSISIKTTMNLVPLIDAVLDSTGATAGVYDYASWVFETTSRADVCKEQGAATTTDKRRGSAMFSLIAPDGTETVLDSAAAIQFPGIAISGMNSRISVDTTKLKKSGKLVQSGMYQVRVVAGSEERVIRFSIVSDAVNVRGVMLDANGDGQPDSVFLRAMDQAVAFKNPVKAVVRWADRAGAPDSAQIPSTSLVRQPGDSTLAGTFLLPSRTECPPLGCGGPGNNMGAVYTTNGGDTIRNPIISLDDGIAPVADSAWLVYDTTGTGKDTLYVIASEALVSAIGAALPIGDSAFALTGRTIARLPVPGTATIVGNLVKIAITPTANPIQPGDSIRLGGYSGDAKGNTPGLLSRWVPLNASPVAISWMLDANGDGAPDSIGFGVRGSLGTATSATVHWKTAAGQDTILVIPTAGIGTGLALPSGILRNATYCAGCYVEVAMDGTKRRIVLLDSVAPVALAAKLRFGITKDTLLVTVSEAFTIGMGAGEGAAATKLAVATDRLGTLVGGAASAEGNILRIVVDTGTVAADSLRLRSWILGNLNKAVGLNSPFAPIEYGPQPITVVLFDRNGDGQADSVRFRLARSATGAPVPASFSVTWAGTTATATTLAKSADGRSWSGAIGPFPVATMCTGDCTGWITTSTGDKTSYVALVEDSIAPVAVSATLRYGFGGEPDTLDVKASEPLVKGVAGAWVETGTDRSAIHGHPLAATIPGTVTVDAVRLIVPSGTIPSSDSIIRLGNLLSDAGGARVGDVSRWVVLASAARGRATLYDADQDGAADSVWFDVRGRLGSGAATLVWGEGADGTRSVTIPGGVSTSFGMKLSTPFPFGATGCTATSGCTVRLADGASIDLLDGVAPVATRARYRFGTTATDPDTLYMTASEPLRTSGSGANAWDDWGIPGASRVPVPFTSINFVAASSTETMAIIPVVSVPAITATHAGLATAPQTHGFIDYAGVTPGTVSPMVAIEYGPVPVGAALSDRDGDGRGEGVSIQMQRSAPVTPSAASFTIQWNDVQGAPLTRTIAVSELAWDAGSRSWSGSLKDPFPYGATSCAAVCGGSVSDSSGTNRAFRFLLDSIAPVPVKADFRYSVPEVARDTLIVVLSEAWGNPDASGSRPADPIVSVGTKQLPIPLVDALSWSLGADGRTIVFILDGSTATMGVGDSVRLIGDASARVRDNGGNRPGVEAPWFPITFGLRPPWLRIGPYPGFAKRNEGEVWPDLPAGTPPIEVFIRPVKGGASAPIASGPWSSADGSVVGIDTTQSLGIILTLNRPVEGYVYIYDNLGIHVGSLSLADIIATWKATGKADESRQIWIRWKGIGPDGKIAPSGVYLFRLLTWRIPDSPREEKEVINRIFRLGWNP